MSFVYIMTLMSLLFTANLSIFPMISKFISNFVAMNLILQCAVLFGFLAAGELIVWLTAVPVP